MYMLSLEIVSAEASQDVHTYTTIMFQFPSDGGVTSSVNVYTMRLNMYETGSDFLRLGLEIIYVLALLYNIFRFRKNMRERNE